VTVATLSELVVISSMNPLPGRLYESLNKGCKRVCCCCFFNLRDDLHVRVITRPRAEATSSLDRNAVVSSVTAPCVGVPLSTHSRSVHVLSHWMCTRRIQCIHT